MTVLARLQQDGLKGHPVTDCEKERYTNESGKKLNRLKLRDKSPNGYQLTTSVST